jgi:hypothetical protein
MRPDFTCHKVVRNMAESHFGCKQNVTNGHIWGTYPDYIPDVNRMFLLGECWAKCLNACNVLSMFPLKSRNPCPQCLKVVDPITESDDGGVDVQFQPVMWLYHVTVGIFALVYSSY